VWIKFKKVLELMSLGKYEMKLYDERRNGQYSSWGGGLVTLLMIIFIFFLSFRILVDTFTKKNTYVVDKQIRMEDSIVRKMTIGQLVKAGLAWPKYQVQVP
jgi:hypothetical protein